MAPPKDNTRGILAMNVAMLAFIVNDAFVKAASATLPLGEIVFVRGLFGVTVIGIYCWWAGAFVHARHLADRRLALRLLGEVGATLFYLAGLARMPIGDATAIFQITPLVATAGAAIFLRETVGWRRWAAIAVGFVGVMIIIRPGPSGLTDGAPFILCAVAAVVMRDLATARLPAALPTSLTTFATSVTVTFVGILYIPLDPWLSRVPTWRPIPFDTFLQLIGSGTGLIFGHVFMTIAMRTGEMSAIAPFRYALLVWSFLIGFFAFGDRPDAWTLIGAAIVVATGLYSAHRERIRARAAVAASTAAVAP